MAQDEILAALDILRASFILINENGLAVYKEVLARCGRSIYPDHFLGFALL